MDSPGSWFRQALVARRQTAFAYEAITSVEFVPDNFQQLAGLILYYNASKFHYLYISTDESIGRHIGIMSCAGDPSLDVSYPIEDARIPLPATGPVHLRATVDGAKIRFAWSLDRAHWSEIPAEIDGGVLGDEAGKGEGANFTGTFVGVCCHDVSGARKHADFDYFAYRPKP
jgi:xylan 1,4-beta-xylosidase